MDAWEGEKLINTNGRSKNTLAGVESGVTSKRGRKRSPPALLKTINGAELDGEATDPDDDLEARGEERDSSSDSSESSNSSSTSASSTGSSSGGSGHHHHVRSVRGRPKGSGLAPHSQMWEQDEQGEYIVITCAENEAKLYKERFGRGSIGKSVLFRSRWLTPNEFQAVSGRQSSKDWKRSIRLRGRCLKEYINDGLFKEHEKNCLCKVCLGGDTELLRQEGVIALAAKRRRLSHADSGFGQQQLHASSSGGGGSGAINSNNATINTSSSGTSVALNAAALGELTPPTSANNVATPTSAANMASVLTEGTSERRLPGSTGLGAKRKRKSGPRGNKKSQQRVWSPSGELAQEMEHQEGEIAGSSNEEEDDYKPSRPGPGSENNTMSKSSVIDASDFLPRRSKRSTHRKHTGHRTELGTYTRKPSEWDPEEVAEFLRLQGFTDCADSFQEYEIDGQSMFLLKEHHLLERFSMKLGPALRLLDTISRLRHPPV